MPKTSVSPEAMVKIIMPIASPAAVSVKKVDNEPMRGAATRATMTGVSAGTISTLRRGRAAPTSSALIGANPG